jgi:predicted TIM-barrel fold metal-dependent hydrolase
MDLSGIPVLDHHAHNIVLPEVLAEIPYPASFTEASNPEAISRYAPDLLAYRRSLRDLAELFGVVPSEEALLGVRDALGLEALTRRCFEAANMEMLFLDDGLLPGKLQPLAWHEQFVPVRRVLRLEVLAQEVIASSSTFSDFLEAFRAALDPLPEHVVSFKSIAAYRTGLAIEPVAEDAAHRAFAAFKRAHGDAPARLDDKALIDLVVREGLEVAAHYELPVQFHTGFGDPDLDLRLANPLHLRPLLEDPKLRNAPLVLLHASYPYTREVGYLAAVYPQVFVDFGLAVPCLSVQGMHRAVAMLLELAPISKVLYSSDAHLAPELYYVCAKWGRKVLGDVLAGAVADGDLSGTEADAAAEAILRGNARELYL